MTAEVAASRGGEEGRGQRGEWEGGGGGPGGDVGSWMGGLEGNSGRSMDGVAGAGNAVKSRGVHGCRARKVEAGGRTGLWKEIVFLPVCSSTLA